MPVLDCTKSNYISRAGFKCNITWRRSWSTGTTGVANGWKSRGWWTLGTTFIWCHHGISIGWLIDFCWWHWQWRSQMVFTPSPNWKWEVDMIIRAFFNRPFKLQYVCTYYLWETRFIRMNLINMVLAKFFGLLLKNCDSIVRIFRWYWLKKHFLWPLESKKPTCNNICSVTLQTRYFATKKWLLMIHAKLTSRRQWFEIQ